MDNRQILMSLRSDFERVWRELNIIKDKLDNLTKEQGDTKLPIQNQTKGTQEKPNQRTGGYTPEDVALENIFYVGKR